MGMSMRIDATGLDFQKLNAAVRAALAAGNDELCLDAVNGQYYLGAGLQGDSHLVITGTPGNDTACYMDGPELTIYGNVQDEVGNTMNSGRVIVHGLAGDVLGYGMRGGEIFIRDSVGYRVGIHMKEYQEQCPVIVVGGFTGAFLGEYMAGGRIIVLGRQTRENKVIGRHCGSGMHGGRIYIRGKLDDHDLSPQIEIGELDEGDREFLRTYIGRYCSYFNVDEAQFADQDFTKILPMGKRPYAAMYAGL